MKHIVRNQHIDIMKGFAILLVLLGHRFMTNTVEGAQHPVSIIIYSFHMAFFFFISSYVNEITHQLERKGIVKFIYDKVRTLMLPFVVWTLICFWIDGGNSLNGFVSSLNFYPVNGYWFLPVLFVFICLITKKIHTFWVIFIILFIILGLLIKQVFPIWYASYLITFLLGGYMADVDIEKKLTTNHAYGISALVLVMCWCIYPFEASSLGKSGNLFLIFVIALVSCITFFNFFKKIQLPEFLATYFSEIGKYTLVLYLVPVLILPAKTFVLNGQVTFASENLIILSIAVLHSLVSYVIGRIIYEIPYLRLILFGKK